MKERKCMGVEKLSDNPFLNLYHIDAYRLEDVSSEGKNIGLE